MPQPGGDHTDWHTSLDQNGEPYELTEFVMRGDMTGLLYDMPIE